MFFVACKTYCNSKSDIEHPRFSANFWNCMCNSLGRYTFRGFLSGSLWFGAISARLCLTGEIISGEYSHVKAFFAFFKIFFAFCKKSLDKTRGSGRMRT